VIRTAFAFLLLAMTMVMVVATATAEAQERRMAHMEGCLVWSRDGSIATRNECSRPIALKYMDLDVKQTVTTELAPGGRFTSDSIWGQTTGFIFTACPLGFRPSVPFSLENKEAIGVSLYNCVGGEPTSWLWQADQASSA
jgi:hypothetical protein